MTKKLTPKQKQPFEDRVAHALDGLDEESIALIQKTPLPQFKDGAEGVVEYSDDDSKLLATLTLCHRLGAPDLILAHHRLNQVSPCFRGEASAAKRVNMTLSAVAAIAPQDEVEGMLAAQMVATHNAAMEFVNRSLLDEQPTDICDNLITRATKLLRVYSKQVEALNRYRGKGQQKMTVEHVHVYEGGQAIVGPVQGGGG